jgi:hypothetical protein
LVFKLAVPVFEIAVFQKNLPAGAALSRSLLVTRVYGLDCRRREPARR